jgi:hypothetical protein
MSWATGMEMVAAFRENTATDGTYISSGRQLDYIFVTGTFQPVLL